MTEAPGHVDYSRATRLLIYTVPERVDIPAINSVLTDIQSDGRATQAILALCTIVHSLDKGLSTERGIEGLRQIVAALTLRAEDDD